MYMYTVHQSKSNDYAKLYLTVMSKKKIGRSWDNRTEITIEFQADRENYQKSLDESNLSYNAPWYGADMIVKAENLEVLAFANKVMRKILGKDFSSIYGLQPIRIIENLKAERIVYDSRLGKYVPVDEICQPGKQRWIDDWKRLNQREVKYECLASDETEAKKLILQKAANENDTEYITKFISCEQPVLQDRYGYAPEVESLEEVLRPKF